MIELAKPTTWRSEAYLDWIRAMPCLSCGAPEPSEPHHVVTGGMSNKCSDAHTVPLCHRCHRLAQAHQWDVLVMRYGFGAAEMWKGCAILIERWFCNETD